jgi:hypothetical protein
MLLKKLKHVALEKFCVTSESNGWGKGVGRTGGDAGTVGIGWLVDDVEDVEDEPTEDGKPAAEDEEATEVGELLAEVGKPAVGGGPPWELEDGVDVGGGTLLSCAPGCRL